MIIQIRGTSGSGKSTVMRAVMAKLGDAKPICIEGRRNPLLYWIEDTVILGHYETQCGGCDTIGSARAVYELIQEKEVQGAEHVLCEGLLLSEDVKWSSELGDLRVIFLTTPVEECLQRIRRRRLAAGNTKPLSEKNTRNRVAVIERARLKLVAQEVPCVRTSGKQAVKVILRWLKQK